MSDIDRLGALSDRHAQQRDSIILKLVKALLGLWSQYDYWSDSDITTGMAARSAELVDAATGRVRLLERSYLGTVLGEMDAAPRKLPPVVNGYARANVTATEVYRRPVETFLWARRNGVPFADATEEAIARLEQLATTDLLTAERDEADVVYSNAPKVLGYRRVIHPELSRSGSCGLCIVASHNRYSVGDLLPLHNECNCDTMPITKGDDPGFRLNDADLKRIYAAAGSTAADALVNVRATIGEHGELGPLLVKKGDHFRTPEEAGRPKFVPATPASIRADRTRELGDLRTAADQAQARYDAFVRANPSSLKANGDNGERIALFRSIKYMRERVTSLERFLKTLPN